METASHTFNIKQIGSLIDLKKTKQFLWNHPDNVKQTKTKLRNVEMRPKLAIQDGGQREEEEEGGKWPYLRHVYYLPGGEIGAEGLKNQLKKNTGMKKVKKEKEGRRGRRRRRRRRRGRRRRRRRRRGKEGEGEEGEGRKEREKKKGKKKKEKMNKERKKRRSRAPVSLTVEDHQGPLEIS